MKHLRNRVFYKILIPTLIIYLLISSVAFIIYRRSYINSAANNKQTEMDNLSRVLGDWIAARVSELMYISEAEELLDDSEQFNFLQTEISKKQYLFENFWLIDEDLNYINTNYQSGEIFEKDKLAKLFTREFMFSYIAPQNYWAYSKDRILLFSVPVVEGGSVVAILGGSILLTELDRVIKLYSYKVFDEYVLIDVNDSKPGQLGGGVILHTDSAFIGLREISVFKRIYASNTYSNIKNYFVSDLINNWKFIGVIDSKNLYTQLALFSRLFIFLTLLLVLVISLLTTNIAGSIAAPILQLREMVDRMLRGDFNNVINLNTQDELEELAEAFNLLNRRNIQLRTDDRFVFLGRISSRMAHEIRHPLHIMQIAMQSMNGENIQAYKGIIGKEIKKAELFIREVLEIAKPNELSLQYYSMDRLLVSILKSYEILMEEKSISIQYINSSKYDSCYFDVLKLEQVITNILNNSIDATPEMGEIILLLENEENRNLRLTISDTGRGFSEEHIDRVFDPYFTTKESGTGLGLSICYQILTAHGANIELKNRELGGAETVIIFTNKTGDHA